VTHCFWQEKSIKLVWILLFDTKKSSGQCLQVIFNNFSNRICFWQEKSIKLGVRQVESLVRSGADFRFQFLMVVLGTTAGPRSGCGFLSDQAQKLWQLQLCLSPPQGAWMVGQWLQGLEDGLCVVAVPLWHIQARRGQPSSAWSGDWGSAFILIALTSGLWSVKMVNVWPST
jgi:hypothetical protein